MPQPWNKTDADLFVSVANKLNSSLEKPFENLNQDLLRLFAYTCAGSLCPVNSIIGGIVAQEVMKACTGKFHPIVQFFYYDCREVLEEDAIEKYPKQSNNHVAKNRYASQLAVFGKEFQDKLANTKCFLVGSGALGCEYIKNFAMMGLCCGPNGKLTVTDMDSIEKSNLNRQFLFRSWDGKFY